MKVGDRVKIAEVPHDLHPTAVGCVKVGMFGTVSRAFTMDGKPAVEVSLDDGGCLAGESRYFTLQSVEKIAPGSAVRVSSVQNISVDVLGEGRTINVSAGQVVDWFDENGKHAALSDVSRLMGVKLRQAIRKLVDAEKLLEFVSKDEPDHAHLRYIEVSSRITNGVLSIVDDIENWVSDAVF